MRELLVGQKFNCFVDLVALEVVHAQNLKNIPEELILGVLKILLRNRCALIVVNFLNAGSWYLFFDL